MQLAMYKGKISAQDVCRNIISYQKTSTAKLEDSNGACFDTLIKEGGLSAYITKIEKDGKWGDSITIITAAFAYERQIIIFHQNNKPILTCDEHVCKQRSYWVRIHKR